MEQPCKKYSFPAMPVENGFRVGYSNYTYDEFNRLTKIKYPEAAAGAGRLEEKFTYDLAGNLLTKTD